MKSLEARYLDRLAELYPSIAAASTEVINLEAILNLPKGTEHFMTDIHGEYEAFNHVLKNGSGSVRSKIEEAFGNTLGKKDKQTLATLIYYPAEKMRLILADEPNVEDWYKITLYRLITVARNAASKYTRSKVRKALPKEFAYVLEELLTEKGDMPDKESYYDSIVDTIIRVGRAKDFIIALSELIQRLVVDHLHIVGDIFDRGPGPHIIMDKLMQYHSLDIQWGNHDVLWMGAAAGQLGCICNVIRICARYGNMDILEDGYGINMLPLASYATTTYADDPCTVFKLKGSSTNDPKEIEINLKVHKAISILQWKAEGQTIMRHPEFHMEDRNLLHLINWDEGTITIDGNTYKMLDMNFPTVDRENPYAFTEQEQEIMDRLVHAFQNCEKLQEHVKFLLSKGTLYKVYNNNLMYHGCILLNDDGTFRDIDIYGKTYRGKGVFDAVENYIRKAFMSLDEDEREKGRDLMWWSWLHKDSPLFGKDKMATFERYYIAEKETHKERKNAYYQLYEKAEVIDRVLREFGLDNDEARISNGHVPVKSKDGESPIKCGGRLLVIDGGFSRAYQKDTGIAGYTLIYNSYGMILAAHQPFESTEAAIVNESDIHSDRRVVSRVNTRKRVRDTDIGRDAIEKIHDLEMLLEAYRSGAIAEKFTK